METKRITLATILATRQSSVGKDGLLTNCYTEQGSKAKRIVKRPGLFTIGSLEGDCEGQGAFYFAGGAVFIKCDTLYVEDDIGAEHDFGDDEWILRQLVSPTFAGVCTDAAFDPANGDCVMPNAGRAFRSLDDGLTWAESTGIRNTFGGGASFTDAAITFDASTTRFVTAEWIGNAGNPEGSRFSTDSGQNWTIDTTGDSTSGYGNMLRRIAYDSAESQLVSVTTDRDGGLPAGRRSLNGGTTWSAVTSLPVDVGFNDIAYGDGAYVLVTENTTFHGGGALPGQVMINLDDVSLASWEYKSAAAVKAWKRVCFVGSNTFVALAFTGELMRSTDRGETWATVSIESKAWKDLASDEAGNVIAVANNSGSTTNSMLSRDYGVTWVTKSYTVDVEVSCITYGRANRFICSGHTGAGVLGFFTLDIGTG